MTELISSQADPKIKMSSNLEFADSKNYDHLFSSTRTAFFPRHKCTSSAHVDPIVVIVISSCLVAYFE